MVGTDWNRRSEATDPPDLKIDLYPSLRCSIQRLDAGFIHQGIHFARDITVSLGAMASDLALDSIEQLLAQRNGRDEQPAVTVLARVTRQGVKQVGRIGSDRGIGREVTEVRVDPTGRHIVIPRAEVYVAMDPVCLAPHDQTHLCMGLESKDPVHHMHSHVFEFARPGNIVFFVEAGLKLHDHRNLLAIDARFHERLDNRRLRIHAIKRLFDGQHIGVGSGLPHKVDHGRKTVIGVIEQQVVLTNGIEQSRVRRDGDRDRRLERRVFQFGTIETDQFHHARDSDGSLDGVDQIRRQLQIPRQRFSDVVRCAASQFQSHRRSEVALVDLRLHGGDQVGRLVFLDFEVRIARDPKWIEEATISSPGNSAPTWAATISWDQTND